MSIDIRNEELLTLEQAAQLLPGKPARLTVWRWCRAGIRDIRLDSVVIGARRYTSHRALAEFAASLTKASEATCVALACDTMPPTRDPAIARKLEAAGLLQ